MNVFHTIVIHIVISFYKESREEANGGIVGGHTHPLLQIQQQQQTHLQNK